MKRWQSNGRAPALVTAVEILFVARTRRRYAGVRTRHALSVLRTLSVYIAHNATVLLHPCSKDTIHTEEGSTNASRF